MKKPLKLDLACGNNRQKGFIGVDIVKKGTQASVQCDLLKFPWYFRDSSVAEIFCSHFLEHVPGPLRGKFMDEIWRILKPGACARFLFPFASSNRAIQDFTHQWPPLCQESFLYFSKAWRKMNKLEHGAYDLNCDFQMEQCSPALSEEYQGKSAEAVQFAAAHYLNTVVDLYVVLRKPKYV